MKFYRHWLLVLLMLILGLAPLNRALAQTTPLADHLHALAAAAKVGVEAAEKGDQKAILAGPEAIEKVWSAFEDDFRAQNPTGYVEIEAALDGINDALKTTPRDNVAVGQAYSHLLDEANEFATHVTSTVATPKATPLADHLQALATAARNGVEAAEKGDAQTMLAGPEAIEKVWSAFEDDFRAQNPTGYVEIEAALDGINEALKATPLDNVVVRQAYSHLLDEANEFAKQVATGASSTTATVVTGVTLAQMLSTLDQSRAALQQGDNGAATEKLTAAVEMWPSIEGVIATKSQDAYTKIEGDLGRATATLRAQPVNVETADKLLLQLHQTLAPFAESQSYSAFDAAAIILREGLEALLVVVALLAFLRRSNNGDKSGWIWGGAGAGVLVSIGSAFVLQAIFNQVSSGQNRELIEGITGLVAAALLFYVSYWLHSKANLGAWQRYISARTSEVLAKGSMFSLALLAFLAVFREGAETTIFYLGMAPSIAARDLWLGLGLGFGLLAIAAYFILVVGIRLPLRLFFRVAGLLVYYLGFKFVGAGIHALQVAGLLPASPIAFLREAPFFGFYPTWETLIPQILLLVGAVVVMLYLRNLERQARLTPVVSA
ncbi:MAG: FTR1 family protein [Caldilineaceae bacterium]